MITKSSFLLNRIKHDRFDLKALAALREFHYFLILNKLPVKYNSFSVGEFNELFSIFREANKNDSGMLSKTDLKNS
jgi:hypothetical protein